MLLFFSFLSRRMLFSNNYMKNSNLWTCSGWNRRRLLKPLRGTSDTGKLVFWERYVSSLVPWSFSRGGFEPCRWLWELTNAVSGWLKWGDKLSGCNKEPSLTPQSHTCLFLSPLISSEVDWLMFRAGRQLCSPNGRTGNQIPSTSESYVFSSTGL